MATSIAQPRREASQCYRCGLQAVQPKLLPCLHIFCLQCLKSEELERYERSPEGLTRMPCPECSTEFAVPREGLSCSGLPPDIFVERLVKMQKGLCDVCSEDQSSVSSAIHPQARLNTKGKGVWGVTAMNGYIYVLSKDSVFIYDPEISADPVEEICIPEQKYLTDIAASSLDSCLYVTDQGDKRASNKVSCIWKIEKGHDNKYSASKWLKVSFKLLTLSVSPKGHVVVPVSCKTWNNLSIYRSSIYRSDGELMKKINLPYSYPNHAIELANGNFVVAFGKSESCNLCEINDKGEVVKRFANHQLSLNHPWHVAFFGNDELLIADSKNNRVLWLDLHLNVKQELLTEEKDGIIEPRRMCYAQQNNLLMIVYSGTDGKRVVDLYDSRRWLQ